MPAHVKVGGDWEPVTDLHVKVAGDWEPVVDGYVRVDGIWRSFFTGAVAVSPQIQDAGGTALSTRNVGVILYGYRGSSTAGTYTFQWQISSNNSTWSNISGASGTLSGATLTTTYTTTQSELDTYLDTNPYVYYIRFKVTKNSVDYFSSSVIIHKRTPVSGGAPTFSDSTPTEGDSMFINSNWTRTNTLTDDQAPDTVVYTIIRGSGTTTQTATLSDSGANRVATISFVVLSGDVGSTIQVYATASNSSTVYAGTAAVQSATATSSVVTAAPVIPFIFEVSVPSGDITTTSARVNWSSVNQSTYQISGGGLPTTYTGGTDQTRVLTGLSPSTTYNGAILTVISSTLNTATEFIPSFTTLASPSPPVNTIRPTISNVFAGSTASSTSGTWTGNPSPTFTYDWQIRPNNGNPYTVTGRVESVGGTGTLTINPNAFRVGDIITVTDVLPLRFQGTFTITARTATTISYFTGGGGLGQNTITYTNAVTPQWTSLQNSSSNTYAIGAGQTPNRYLRTQVTATNSQGSATATSDPTNGVLIT